MCQAIFEGLGCLNSRKAPRENCGNRYLRYLAHPSCSSVFLSKIPVNAAFRKPGNIVRFSRHGPVNWQSAPPVLEEGTAAEFKDRDLFER